VRNPNPLYRDSSLSTYALFHIETKLGNSAGSLTFHYLETRVTRRKNVLDMPPDTRVGIVRFERKLGYVDTFQ
jgi:hypothetical protein